jgi:hypothetical protein
MNNVQIEIILHEEEVPVRGNALVSGDAKLDRQVEDYIISRLAREVDPWAWCTVEVRATCGGVSASEYLGCCSYSNEEDFKARGYYEDMVVQAMEQLGEAMKA